MPGSTFYDTAALPAATQPEERGRVNNAIILDEILDHGEANYIDPSGPAALRTPGRAATKGSPEESWWQVRYTFVLLSFLGLMLQYMVRVCLSMTIVVMVSRNKTTNPSEVSDTCPLPDDSPSNTVIVGEFDWSERSAMLVLSAIYYGAATTNFVGGRAAEKFGGRLLFGLGVVVPGALCLLLPVSAHFSEYAFAAIRVLQGMAQGPCVPAMHLMISAWIPPKDKAKFVSCIFTGIQMGTVLGMALGGWLCDTTFLGGWPSVFYLFGCLSMLWGIPWFLLVHNLPEHHPRIASSELEYIQTHRHYVKADKPLAFPWRKIATSKPFWAVLAANLTYNYCFYTLLTELPTYFYMILHFNMNKNALGSASPYILQAVSCLAWGYFANYLHHKNFLTVTGIRKLSTSMAMYMSAMCLIAMMWVKCNSVAAVSALCLAVFMMGTMTSGSLLGEQDIAPNLAGSLKGLSNTLSSITGFLTPAIATAITSGNQTVSAWNTVFLIAAVLNVSACTIYLIFGTAQVQKWNDPEPVELNISVIPRLSLDGNVEEVVQGAGHKARK